MATPLETFLNLLTPDHRIWVQEQSSYRQQAMAQRWSVMTAGDRESEFSGPLASVASPASEEGTDPRHVDLANDIVEDFQAGVED